MILDTLKVLTFCGLFALRNLFHFDCRIYLLFFDRLRLVFRILLVFCGYYFFLFLDSLCFDFLKEFCSLTLLLALDFLITPLQNFLSVHDK